jgi:hypothetical protein
MPESRADRWIKSVKNHPIVAAMIVLGVLLSGTLSWVVATSDNLKKVAEITGLRESEEEKKTRHLKLLAFHLGKAVSDYSALSFLSGGPLSSGDHLRDLKAAKTELTTRLSSLELSVNFDEVDFTWSHLTFASPALYLFGDTLSERYGQEMLSPYTLGADLMSDRWRTVKLQESIAWHANRQPGDSRASADTILADLDARATDIVGKVDFEKFQPSMELRMLAHTNNSEADSMLWHILTLDAAVETQLSR